MPVDARGRAAASIAQPLDAEVLVDGAWLSAAVLGWRHDDAGGCRAEVRVVLGGAPQFRWVDLGSVRLPEMQAPAAEALAPRALSSEIGSSEIVSSEVLSSVASASRVEGGPRGSAPAETVMMNRSELRGLLASGAPASRRRRHAAELTAEFPAVRCAEMDSGRHRAPASTGGVGRHRVAHDETGRLAAVPTPRSGGAETDLWTRPIRMDDSAGWPWSASSA